MAKRDLGLAGAVEKLVEEKVSKMQAVGQIPPPESEDSDFVDQVNSSSSPEVKKMVSSFHPRKVSLEKSIRRSLMVSGLLWIMRLRPRRR
jgi:hypothetical protein